ncbi:MAG TPA: nitroreductase family protein [Terriglobales bacterium]|nr:nitroreductase family protein [Terriglobales bacterium]
MSRRSVRKYRAERVSSEIIERILEAGRHAPSASNGQPWRFIVLTDQGIKEKLSHRQWSGFVRDTAFTVVGCAYEGDAYAQKWSTIDTTIALQNMVIAAWEFGIGSCWVGDFDETEVKKLLNVPEEWKIVALIAFGYPDETPPATTRKPVNETITYNTF